MVDPISIELGYKHILTAGTCECGVPEGCVAFKLSGHDGGVVGKNGYAVSVVKNCSTRLRGPLVGPTSIELGYKHICITGTCECGVAEGCVACEISCHNGSAIGKNGDAVALVTLCSTRLRGPLVFAISIELGYKNIVTTVTCECGVAEGCVAVEISCHNRRAVGKNGDVVSPGGTCSTCFLGPFVFAISIEFGYISIRTTGTCECGIAEGCVACEISRHN